jgi:anti-sigma B factor antagonist
MSCKTKILSHKGVPVIKIIGELMAGDAPKISKKILDVGRGDAHMVAVDLSEMAFIDSTGLGVLVYARQMLLDKGKELVFVSPTESVQSVLQGTNLVDVLKIVDSLENL